MIYIVEDDDAIRELEQYALQSNGYSVQSFASPEPFWQAMRTAEPELVILDVMLPGEDGFSILKKLRSAAGSSACAYPAATRLASFSSAVQAWARKALWKTKMQRAAVHTSPAKPIRKSR